MFVFNDYALMDLIQSYRTTSIPLMFLVGRTTNMPNPPIHGVTMYSILIINILLLLLALSRRKTIKNMKLYSTCLMGIDYVPTSTLVGIYLWQQSPSIPLIKHPLLEEDLERMQIYSSSGLHLHLSCSVWLIILWALL